MTIGMNFPPAKKNPMITWVLVGGQKYLLGILLVEDVV